jgi:predicted nucleotidyltransferase component of viral defense system
MGPEQAARWKNEALDQVFAALAASATLTGRLVFKGARVLNRRLGTDDRQSLDLDMNLTAAFIAEFPSREAQRLELEREIVLALNRRFAEPYEVRYEVVRASVMPKPKDHHPRGWNAFEVRVGLRDAAHGAASQFPVLVLDVAAPEVLGPHAISHLAVEGGEVMAYTLERIAGEKLRAFLTSLPAYRRKLRRPGEAIRAKDLYDVARVSRARPPANNAHQAFWRAAATEFRLACESRFVDCNGIETFDVAHSAARATYNGDATLPQSDINFDTAWEALTHVIARFERFGVFPLTFPLPEDGGSPAV